MPASLPASLAPLRLVAALGAVAGAEWCAGQANPMLARIWGEVVGAMGGTAPATLAPLVGTLGMAVILLVALAILLHAGLLDDPRQTEVAVGIAGHDMPFLLAGLVFVAIYASLADVALQAIGTPRIVPSVLTPATVLGGILVLPVAQELLLRGAVLPTLERRLGAAAAIVLAALPALMLAPAHPVVLVVDLVPQLFFGWIAWSCRSLGAAAVLHVTYAAIGLLLAG